MIPIYLEHYTSSISTRPYLHYAQLFEYNMEFKKFDFRDKAENIKRYGYEEPPSYNLQNVQVPVAIFTAERDVIHPSRYYLMFLILDKSCPLQITNF